MTLQRHLTLKQNLQKNFVPHLIQEFLLFISYKKEEYTGTTQNRQWEKICTVYKHQLFIWEQALSNKNNSLADKMCSLSVDCKKKH